MFRILLVFENVRGLLLWHTFAGGKILGRLADITGIKARTCILINHTRAKPTRDRVFHAKQVAYRKGGKTS